MDSLPDTQNTTSTVIDHQFTQLTPASVATFSSIMGTVHPDANSSAHMQSSMSQSMFSSDFDAATSMSLQATLHSVSTLPSSSQVDLSPMDVVSATLPPNASETGLFSDFSTTCASGFPPDPQMGGIETIDHTQQLGSSPSATTTSTSVSHAGSPAVNGVVPAYAMGSSSLASALDNMAARSRSTSSASPGHLAATVAELGFASSNSGPPTSAHESSFPFVTSFDSGYPSAFSKEPSPDPSGDAHLLVLGDMLKSIARTASSGSEACEKGATTDARGIVDQLRKNVLLVAELVSRLELSDHQIPSAGSSPHAVPAMPVSKGSPPSSTNLDSTQRVSPPHSYTPPNLSDPTIVDSDMSRKRCASTIAGDRVVKSLKLEPDELGLTMQTMHSLPPPNHLNTTSPVFSFNTTPSIPPSMSTIVEHPHIPSVPSSLPASRPSSSAGRQPLAPSHSALSMMNDVSSASGIATVHYPTRLDLGQPDAADFAALSSGPATAPLPHTSTFSAPPSATIPSSGWPTTADGRPTMARHGHTISGGVLTPAHPTLPMSVATSMPLASAPPSFSSPSRAAFAGASASAMGRLSRSSSISHPGPFAYGLPDIGSVHSLEPSVSRPPTAGMMSCPPSPRYGYDDDGDDSDDEHNFSQWFSNGMSGSDESPDSKSSGGRRGSRTSPSSEIGLVNHTNEVPNEYRADVERIFFEFLDRTCSNLDATDSKGEPIHQTLMAKKMQRLDESPDFRPFKFRIQAFTNAFLEELSRQGFPEEKIPMKKIRNFLWNQPYISRFNEEGKKSKSKGNHIWHVDAKKSDGGWVFRPFQRKLAGAPPGVAYVGLRWSWTPRIWDPQASRANMPVKYSSPSLPSWLSWNEDVLSGIPPPDAQSCDVTVEARFVQEGKDEMLSHTVHVNIAPMAAVDASFVPSRRPSLVGADLHNPRRVMSDSVLPQTTPPRVLRAQSSLSPAAPVVAPDSQVVQVLQSAAQRVAQEAQSQVVASPNQVGPELQALAKQQHVLTVTAQAFNKTAAGEPVDGSTTAQSNALAVAAQQVVLQAARQVAADRTVAAVSSGVAPAQATATHVTVKEVSVATQSAVAQAVEMVGPLSSEVDVLMTAKSLLQQQTVSTLPPAPLAVDPSQVPPPLDPTRPHSTGFLPSFPSALAPQAGMVFPQ